MRQPRINKISSTSPDKIHGKLVKYRQGDCLSINCKNGKYLGALISEKFNKYYDFTFIDFYKTTKPFLKDFVEGKIFGTRFGSWEDLTYAVDKRMLDCKYVDSNSDIEKVGSVKLISPLEKASYSYFDTVQQLHDYYLEEIPVRIEKSKNAEKFPDIAFVSKHLIDTKNIIE